MKEIQKKIAVITNEFQSLKASPTAGQSWHLSTLLDGMEVQLREKMQALTRQDLEAVINKLQKRESLSLQDMELIKLWIVGDAEHYIKMENNFNDWMTEIQRLMEELARQESAACDLKWCAMTRALLLDAIRVMGDVFFFLQQKERVGNFADSTAELDDSEREILINILSGKAASNKF